MKYLIYILLLASYSVTGQLLPKAITGQENIYLIKGQSNTCKGRVSGVDVKNVTLNNRCQMFNIATGTFQTAKAGVNMQQPNVDNLYFGPALTLLRKTSDYYKCNQFVIQYGVDGTALGGTGTNVWNSTETNGLFKASKDNYAIGLLAAKAISKDVKVKAIIWIQGEADGATTTLANAYQANLTAYIAAERAFIGEGNTPFIMVSPSVNNSFWPYRSTVVTAMQNIASTIPNCYYLSTDTYTTLYDTYHYDEFLVDRLASRIFDIIVSIYP